MRVSADPLDRKHGMSQADVYQLMAYARLYRTAGLMLLYPAIPGQGCAHRGEFGHVAGYEWMWIVTADVALEETTLVGVLRALVEPVRPERETGAMARMA